MFSWFFSCALLRQFVTSNLVPKSNSRIDFFFIWAQKQANKLIPKSFLFITGFVIKSFACIWKLTYLPWLQAYPDRAKFSYMIHCVFADHCVKCLNFDFVLVPHLLFFSYIPKCPKFSYVLHSCIDKLRCFIV